jgi:type II secretory pathway component GspD/PulD (secretin)
MNTLQPQIVPVRNTEASRVLEVLQSVYKTQLTAGGSRSRLTVPQGLPPQLATLLRTISAASSGPILTLEMDELTNSIIVFAPPQLGKEVADLIRQLDENAKDNASRRINIIALERMNTKRLQQALDLLSRETK